MSRLLNAACKKSLNLLKKGLLIRGEAVEASKRRRSLLDHKIQQLSKGLSEGSVHDVSNDEEDKAENTKLMQKLQRNKLEMYKPHQHPHHQPRKLKFKCVRHLAGKTVQENLASFVSGRQGELYQKTDHVFTFIEVIKMVRLGMIKRSKSENKRIVPTEMELVLEQTQQGTSHEVS
ncbi:hypothetical protein Tco_1257113, partial [Tanacetum coccineum]